MENLIVGCLAIIFIGIMCAITAAIFMLAWNLILPLFGVIEITFLQAFKGVAVVVIIGNIIEWLF